VGLERIVVAGLPAAAAVLSGGAPVAAAEAASEAPPRTAFAAAAVVVPQVEREPAAAVAALTTKQRPIAAEWVELELQRRQRAIAAAAALSAERPPQPPTTVAAASSGTAAWMRRSAVAGVNAQVEPNRRDGRGAALAVHWADTPIGLSPPAAAQPRPWPRPSRSTGRSQACSGVLPLPLRRCRWKCDVLRVSCVKTTKTTQSR